MKIPTCLAVIGFVFLSCTLSIAQPSIGVSVGMTKHLGENFIGLNPTARVNAHCLIRFRDKLVGKFGATYTFMAKDVSKVTVYPKYQGLGQSRDANYTFKLHGPSIYAQTRYYVMNDYYGPIGLYIPFEVGLHILFADGRLENVNTAIYDVPDWYDGPQKSMLLGYSIGAGFGAEFDLGGPFLFLESQFVFPVNSMNGRPIQPVVPMHVVFDAGVRFPMGGNYNTHARYKHKLRRRR